MAEPCRGTLGGGWSHTTYRTLALPILQADREQHREHQSGPEAETIHPLTPQVSVFPAVKLSDLGPAHLLNETIHINVLCSGV